MSDCKCTDGLKVPLRGAKFALDKDMLREIVEQIVNNMEVVLADPTHNGLAPAGGHAGQIYRVNAAGTAYAWEDLDSVMLDVALADPTHNGLAPAGGQAGQIYRVNAAGTAYAWEDLDSVMAGGGFSTRRVITASQTLLAPRSGVYLFNLTGGGGGGGGGGTYEAAGDTHPYAGADGGAGGVHQYFVYAEKGAPINITVGAAGAAGGTYGGGKGGGATSVTVNAQTYKVGGGGGGGGSLVIAGAPFNIIRAGGDGGPGGVGGGNGGNGGNADMNNGGAPGAGGLSVYPTLSGRYCLNTYGYGHGGAGGAAGKSGCVELIY